jgi:hypothetical protein
MAITTPSPPPAAGAVPTVAPGPRDATGRAPAAATTLVVALLLACLYAAFAHGAVGLPEETRLQVGLALLAMAAAAAALGRAGLQGSASRLTWAGVAALVLFAAWSAASISWSVTPDRSWLEANRAIAYVLVVVLAIAAGASDGRAVRRVAGGFLVVAVIVALYALGGKVLPGVLDHAGAIARLRAPLEYWNALALTCALAMPIALRTATDVERRTAGRLAGLAAGLVLSCVMGMTYSRGGVLALLVAVVVLTAVGGVRLRGLLALGLTLLAAAPVLAVAFTLDGLTTNGAPLPQRRDDGLILLAALIGSLCVLLPAGLLLVRYEARADWPARRTRIIWQVLAGVLAALVIGGVTALAVSDRGLGGSISHAADEFTQLKEDRQFDPVRLVSTNSANRWVWWQEALGAFSDRPVKGWGAGSFPLTHRLYRKNELPVSQPHSVPLQFLAETGAVGAVLVLGGLALLFAGAARRLRGAPDDRAGERNLRVALLAGAVAWVVHGLYDWDWDIPGVTLPALIFLGVLGARSPGEREAADAGAAPVGSAETDPALAFVGPRRGGRGGGAGGAAGARPGPGAGLDGRRLALAGTTLLLSLVALSALLPGWSENRTSGAQLLVAEDSDAAQLERAAAEAELASRLNPFDVRSLFVSSAIALARERPLDARRFLLQAAQRQPDNASVWLRLSGVASELADRDGARRAARRALELDPRSGFARALLGQTEGALTPVSSSATAVGTPLPPAPGTTPGAAPGAIAPAATPDNAPLPTVAP